MQDGLKIDSCSQFNNLTWWADLLNATGRQILVENCHQVGNIGFKEILVQSFTQVEVDDRHLPPVHYFTLFSN